MSPSGGEAGILEKGKAWPIGFVRWAACSTSRALTAGRPMRPFSPFLSVKGGAPHARPPPGSAPDLS